jgi:hypothetical protein
VKHRTVIFLGLAAVGLAAAVPAKADPIRIAQAQFPPYEIMTIVRSTGLDPLSRPVRQGPVYVLRALDGYGTEVRVVVDAYAGRILTVRPVVPVAAPYGAVRPRYFPPRYVDPRYPPEPPLYGPGDEYEPEARYAPGPPDPRGPQVVYGSRNPGEEIRPPRPPARVPTVGNAPNAKAPPTTKSTPSAKTTAPAPKSAAVTPANPLALPPPPAEPAVAAKAPADPPAPAAATPAPETSKAAAPAPASSIPPVQTLE